MKELRFLKATLLTCLILLGINIAWGADATLTFSTQGYTNAEQVSSGTIDSYTSWAATDGSTPTAYYSTGSGLRIYNGGKFTVTSTKTIASITLTFSSPSYTFSTSNTTNPQTVTPNATSYSWDVSRTCRLQKVEVTYAAGSTQTTYNVNIDANVSGGTVTADPTSAAAGAEVALTASPAEGYEFGSWNVTNASTSEVITVTNNKFTMPAANVNVSATFDEIQGGGSDENETTGTIEFGNTQGRVAINGNNVSGQDNLGNTWTINTVGTTSFTAYTDHYQVGSKDKPATIITFTTTLPENVNITSMSAKFGGFTDTAGNITLEVDDNSIGSGALNGQDVVEISSNTAAIGKTLTVTVSNIARGVICYYISYTYTSAGGEIVDKTVLVTPTELSHSSLTYNSVDLQWSSIEHAGSYKVGYKKTTEEGWTIVSPSPTTNSCTLSGLTPETSYNWRVVAVPENTNDYMSSEAAYGEFTTEAEPTYEAKFWNNGDQYGETQNLKQGTSVAFPTTDPTTDNEEYVFVGWSVSTVATTDIRPAMVSVATMGTEPLNFYAVYAIKDTDGKTVVFTPDDPGTSTGTLTWEKDGVTLKLSNGQIYTSGTPHTFSITKGTTNYFQISNSSYVINKITATISGTNYKINKVESGATLTTSGTTQTITSETLKSIKCYATSENQIRLTKIEVEAGNITYSGYTTSPAGAAVLTGIAITTQPNKTKYKVGEVFDATGMVVTASYDNGKSKELNSTAYSLSKTTALSPDDETITVSCTERNVTQTANVSINVLALSKIEVTSQPSTTTYEEGQYFNAQGMIVKATWGTGDTTIEEEVTGYTLNPTPEEALTTSITEITISYTHEGITATTVLPITVTAIPSYIVHFSINGEINVSNDKTVLRDQKVKFPTPDEIIGGYHFMGWVKDNAIEGTQPSAPSYIDTDNEIMQVQDASEITYYAVYARINDRVLEYEFTMTYEDFGTSYNSNDGDHTIIAHASDGGVETFELTLSANNIAQQGAVIQFASGTGAIWNKTSLGAISNINITNNVNLDIYYGETDTDLSKEYYDNCGFFRIKSNGQLGKAQQFTVKFKADGNYTDFCTTIPADKLFTVTFSINGSATEMTQNAIHEAVTPPNVENIDPYTFIGWSTAEIIPENRIVPRLVCSVGQNYAPTRDITLYAVFERTEILEGTETSYVIDGTHAMSSYNGGESYTVSINGVDFVFHNVSNNNNNNYLQFRASNENDGYIYSKELPGYIKSIVVERNNEYNTSIFIGDEENSRDNLIEGSHELGSSTYTYIPLDYGKYFAIVNPTMNAVRISRITINCGSPEKHYYTTLISKEWPDIAIAGSFPNSNWESHPLYISTKLDYNKYCGTIDATDWEDGKDYQFKLYSEENGQATWWGSNSWNIDFTSKNSWSIDEEYNTNNMVWKHSDVYPSYYVVAEYLPNERDGYWHVTITGIPAGDYLPGSWNNWLPYEQSVKFDENGILVRSLEANSNYEFKLFDSTISTWHKKADDADVDVIEGSTPDVKFTPSNLTINCKLTTTEAGEYLFFIDKEGDTPYISVVYPSDLAVYKGTKKREIIKCNDWAATQTASKNAIALASPAKKSWAEESTRTNVVVLNADRYTCSKFELTDKENFYTPFDFTSKSMAYSRAQSSNMWGTICLPFTPSAEGVTYYSLVGVPEENDGYGVLTFEKINNPEANTPYVYKMASADSSYKEESSNDLTILAVPEDLDLPTSTGWTLKGVYEKTSVFETEEAMNNANTTNTKVLDPYAFYIKNDKFYKINNNFSIGAFRAYFSATEAAAKCASFSLTEQDTDAIRTLTNPDDEIEGYYNVNGIEMNDVQRGLNIIRFKSGKSVKIMIK